MEINYREISIPRAPLGDGGVVTTDNLFDSNEQVIFDIYEASRDRYRRAADVGANVGVHSILMARQGWEVRAYEPDPEHFRELGINVLRNGGGDLPITAHRVAVSDRAGLAGFVRVLGNTTANHLAGSRECYGPTERINVPAVDCREIFAWADLVKMDVEGHEARLVRATDARTWRSLDAIMEVGTAQNARAIFDHLTKLGVPMWSQKIGWRRVRSIADVPAHHSEGSLFVGRYPPSGCGEA